MTLLTGVQNTCPKLPQPSSPCATSPGTGAQPPVADKVTYAFLLPCRRLPLWKRIQRFGVLTRRDWFPAHRTGCS